MARSSSFSPSVVVFVASALGAVGTAGCAPPPPILGALQVGAHEPATWVYIKSEDRRENGVYRCVDTPQGAFCKRAKMAD